MHLTVTAGVIRKGGRILIARRAAGAMAGRWEFPGGKIEPGETAEKCMARELREELGLRVDVGALLHRKRLETPRGLLELLFFDVRNPRGRMRLRDHDCIKWVWPSRLPAYDWVPADCAFARRLAKAHDPISVHHESPL